MKIVALTKTFYGEEWVEASIRSIYDFVDKIVLVHSNVSWFGSTGNRVWSVVKEMPDPDQKFVNLHFDAMNQLEQCQHGYDCIKANIPCDYVMLFDVDEVWDRKDLERAKWYLEHKPGYNAYRCNMYTYVKSPFYRVVPVEVLSPVVFIKPDLGNMGTEARACTIEPYLWMDDVFYHHFVYVRDDYWKILEKIVHSNRIEKQAHEPIDWWTAEKWYKLPNCIDIHPAIGYQQTWKEVKVYDLKDLPEILQKEKFKIMESFTKKEPNEKVKKSVETVLKYVPIIGLKSLEKIEIKSKEEFLNHTIRWLLQPDKRRKYTEKIEEIWST